MGATRIGLWANCCRRPFEWLLVGRRSLSLGRWTLGRWTVCGGATADCWRHKKRIYFGNYNPLSVCLMMHLAFGRLFELHEKRKVVQTSSLPAPLCRRQQQVAAHTHRQAIRFSHLPQSQAQLEAQSEAQSQPKAQAQSPITVANQKQNNNQKHNQLKPTTLVHFANGISGRELPLGHLATWRAGASLRSANKQLAPMGHRGRFCSQLSAFSLLFLSFLCLSLQLRVGCS